MAFSNSLAGRYSCARTYSDYAEELLRSAAASIVDRNPALCVDDVDVEWQEREVRASVFGNQWEGYSFADAVHMCMCAQAGHQYYDLLISAGSVTQVAEEYGLNYEVIGDNMITYVCPRCKRQVFM
jgi:hypothetical protein